MTAKAKNFKAYEITVQGEKEWIIAHTAIDALQVYNNITDSDIIDFDCDDDIILLSEEQTDNITIEFEDDDLAFSLTDLLNDAKKSYYVGGTAF